MPYLFTDANGTPTMEFAGGTNSGLKFPSRPLNATAAVTGTELSGGGRASFDRIYRSHTWVGTANRRMSEQVSRLPMKAYKRVSDDEVNRVRDHELVQLLRRPWPGGTWMDLQWDMQLGLGVQGNYVGWKRRPRDGAPPQQLWSLDWRWVIPHADSGGIVEYWEWVGAGVPDCPRYITPNDIVHLRWRGVEGPLGVSPLEQLGATIRSEDAIQRSEQAHWQYGTQLGLLVSLDDNLLKDPVVRAGVLAELEGYSGPDNAGQNLALNGIKDVHEMPRQSAVEAQLIEQRKVNRDEVAAIYGIPPPLMGILEHATLANVSEYRKLLYTTALGPSLSMIPETLAAQLLETEARWAGGIDYLEFELGEVLKGDTLERMKAYALALQNGVLTLNDVRRLENRPPYPDPRADEPLIASNNMQPLSAIDVQTALDDPNSPQNRALLGLTQPA